MIDMNVADIGCGFAALSGSFEVGGVCGAVRGEATFVVVVEVVVDAAT